MKKNTEEVSMDDVTIIRMDPESPEWKQHIAELQEKLRNKYNGDLHEDNSPGYRK